MEFGVKIEQIGLCAGGFMHVLRFLTELKDETSHPFNSIRFRCVQQCEQFIMLKRMENRFLPADIRF